MHIKGVLLVILGIVGAAFVGTFDIIVGKPVNDITGPKSILALIICALLIITGITVDMKRKKK